MKRVTMQAKVVMAEMLSKPQEEFYGSDLAQRLGLTHGGIFPLLNRLERDGWLVSRRLATTGFSKPRRMYRLTPLGLAAMIKIMSDV